MASTYSDLKFELIGTGDQSGTWGTTTNTNLGTAIEEAITGSADVTFSSGTVTLTLTDTNGTQTARNLRLNLTGTSGGAQDLVVPAIEKQYIVNNGCADAITVKVSGQTGVAVPAGKTMILFNNGTDVVDAVTHLSSLTLGTDLAIAQGGTGASTADSALTNLGATTTGKAVFTAADAAAVRTAAGAGAVGGNVFTAATAAAAQQAMDTEVGVDVQAYDADLTAIGGLAKTDGNFIVGNGSTWVAESGATARTSLGLGALAVESTVDTALIDNNAITTAKILDANVTTAKIADSNITTAKIADSNITTAKIADLQVTADKLASTLDLSLKTVTLNSDFLKEVASTLSANGYITLNNGLMIQWGKNTNTAGATVSHTFATPFPNNCWVVNLQRIQNTTGTLWSTYVRTLSNTGFTFYAPNSGGQHFFIAIGN